MTTAVPSPPPRVPRYGLVASVGGEVGVADFMRRNASEGGANRWEAGYEFVPDDCTSATNDAADPCDINEFVPADLPDMSTWRPVQIWDGVKCSTFSNNSDDLRRRAEAKLLASTSIKLEDEVWNGTRSAAAGFGNAKLRDATALMASAAQPMGQGLGIIQQVLGERMGESRGMIHGTVMTASMLQAHGFLRSEGGLLLDAFDNIFVAGAGYDGSSPGGVVDATYETAWVYATPMVDVRMSEVLAGTRQMAEMLSPNENVVSAVAYRMVSASWSNCALLGIKLDLCRICCS